MFRLLFNPQICKFPNLIGLVFAMTLLCLLVSWWLEAFIREALQQGIV